ncbi:MAG: hypothetical protein HY773_00650 [Candidatus Terrybacteria bacterium]|nr:hypothetical protein [Candidatus Terrybacteria bacterium]
MNNKIKNLIYGFSLITLMVVIFAPAGFLYAADLDSWRNESIKLLQIKNYSTTPGSGNWQNYSVSASPGEIISLLVHYHNFTSTEVAQNVRIRVDVPTGNSNSHMLRLYFWADNSPTLYDSVTVNVSNSQYISFVTGSVLQYQGGGSATVPSGGDNIVTASGLNIGNVSYGNSESGYITLRLQLSNNSTTGGIPTATTTSATNITQTSAILNGTVNPNSNSTSAWFEWGTTSSLGNTLSSINAGNGSSNVDVAITLSGLSENTVYYYRAVAQNSYGIAYGSIMNFVTLGGSGGGSCNPTVSTQAASFITANSATVRGIINPQGRTTSGWFEYDTAYSLSYRTSTQDMGSGTMDADLLRYLSTLATNTTYYYRAVAQNSCGTTYGSILSFSTGTEYAQGTAPQVNAISPATEITQTSALFSASVNPKNSETTAWFEWGLGSTFVSYNSSSPLNIGTGDLDKLANARPLTLSPNTTYYFRAAAKNYFGTTYSAVLNFQTLSPTIVSQPTQPTQPSQPTSQPSAPAPSSSVSVSPTTTILGLSLMALEMSADRDTVGIGKTFTYSVIYRNTGIADADNNLLKVVLPKNVVLMDAGLPNYSLEENVLFFKLGKINKDEFGSLDIKVKVGDSAENGEKLTATGILDFTDAKANGQPNISASAASEVGSTGFLGTAATGFSLAELPWWFYLVVIMGAVIFFARYKISKILKI